MQERYIHSYTHSPHTEKALLASDGHYHYHDHCVPLDDDGNEQLCSNNELPHYTLIQTQTRIHSFIYDFHTFAPEMYPYANVIAMT